jgi:hypothetical protein
MTAFAITTPSAGRHRLRPQQESTADVALYGAGIKFVRCSANVTCGNDFAPGGPGPKEEDISLRLSVYGTSGTALFKQSGLGFAKTAQMAIALLPAVTAAITPDPFMLTIAYNIQGAIKYDWSKPPDRISDAGAEWNETVVPTHAVADSAGAVELTGINHSAQAASDRRSLWVGVLLGLVGAAVLTAVAEALHKEPSG